MPELLLELFSEEIPARMQVKAAEDLRQMVTDALVEAGWLRQHGGRVSMDPWTLDAVCMTLSLRSLDRRCPGSHPARKNAVSNILARR